MQKFQKYNRKSIRLKNYDYSSASDYYITICSHNRECIFGEVINREMILNDLGKIVEKEILNTQKMRKNILIEIFQVMPNHVHLIITILCDNDCRGDAVHRPKTESENIFAQSGATHRVAPTLKPNTIGSIIGQIKSTTTKQVNILRNTLGKPVWQRGYYEHVIHNQKSYDEIYAYILSNPQTWNRDRNNPRNFQ